MNIKKYVKPPTSFRLKKKSPKLLEGFWVPLRSNRFRIWPSLLLRFRFSWLPHSLRRPSRKGQIHLSTTGFLVVVCWHPCRCRVFVCNSFYIFLPCTTHDNTQKWVFQERKNTSFFLFLKFWLAGPFGMQVSCMEFVSSDQRYPKNRDRVKPPFVWWYRWPEFIKKTIL